MGIEHIKISKAGAPFRHAPARRAASPAPDPSCATGAFYTAPAQGASYDSLTPLNISWQPSLNCLTPSPSHVDIYLDAPGATAPRMHLWSGVPYSQGSYSAQIMPRWWNSSTSQTLQVTIVAAGTPSFLASLPAGPIITATYQAPTDGTTPAAADTSIGSTDSGTTVVSGALSGVSSHTLSPGKKAAAVILPLLFVILLGAAYLKITRMRGQKKRSEWSEKLDKRMSTISTDWKAITPGGAREAVRQSIATTRQSMAFNFNAGSVRTSNVEGDPVVMGEKAPVAPEDVPRTSLGSGVGVGVGARRPRTHATPPERGSRAVSFADTAHPRPSLSNSVYSRTSRAFHTASTYGDAADSELPPVPALPSPSRISAYGDAGRGITSPRQTAGPLTLTPEDIRRRMAGNNGQGQEAWRQSVDEVFGALSLMRTGSTSGQHIANGSEEDGGDYLFAPTNLTTGPASSSPFPMPMQQSAMSPDEMLRAYARTQPAAPSSDSGSSGRSSPSILSKALPLALKSRTRASTHSNIGKSPLAKVSPLSNSSHGAQVVPSLHGTGMRVLYDQGTGASASAGDAEKGKVIPAGPNARLSR
ncbi:hypothetical protein FB45DRAFT_737774 [Roridomyces roridus]|uniref:Uncharacterized protein n=1 Tax=Roridomyces roridus TaxID=1738132 RepID=A0AAD7FT91_9AGAR|nr:hypothetical protein FB45DRAFT_737774 [Roridomyces roridus]